MTVYRAETELLTRFAAGAASPGVALLMAAHLERSPASRASLAELDALGGALLEDGEAAPMAGDALDRVFARLDEMPIAPGPSCRPRHEPGPLPGAVIDAVGTDFARIPWRLRLPGLSDHHLKGFGPESVSLIRARPGARIPKHTHDGREVTLVMTGALEDDGRIYRPGEIALHDESHDHSPRIVGEEMCHCLVVMSGSLRFTGVFSRALNYLGE